jgi:hypothetical protein
MAQESARANGHKAILVINVKELPGVTALSEAIVSEALDRAKARE